MRLRYLVDGQAHHIAAGMHCHLKANYGKRFLALQRNSESRGLEPGLPVLRKAWRLPNSARRMP